MLSHLHCAGIEPRLLAPWASTSSTSLPAHLGFQGVPGVLDVPVAASIGSGEVDAFYTAKRDLEAQQVAKQYSLGAALGLAPFLTVGMRGAIFQRSLDTTSDGDFVPGVRDGSAAIHLLALNESRFTPSIALGMTDVGGSAVRFRTTYGVLSKTFFDRLRISAGYGLGPNWLDGPFAGLEFQPCPYFQLLTEYDATDLGFGVRVNPLPEVWTDLGIPRISGTLAWTQESGVNGQIALRYTLGEAKFRAQHESARQLRFARGQPSQDLRRDLERALIDKGLEDIEVTLSSTTGGSARIEFENRTYNRSELDGIAMALGLVTMTLPASFDRLLIVVRQNGLRILEISADLNAFLEYLNEQIDESMVRDSLAVRTPGLDDDISSEAPSLGKIDLTVRPNIQTYTLTELGVIQFRLTLSPALEVRLWPGLVLNGQVDVPVTQTSDRFGDLEPPSLGRWLIRQSFRLPWTSEWLSAALVQFRGGRFQPTFVGFDGEAYLGLFDGWLSLGALGGRIGPTFDTLFRNYFIAKSRARWDATDSTIELSYGFYPDGDTGARLEVSRRFGTTEVGFFGHAADRATMVGAFIEIPLTLPRELPPFWVRPVLPRSVGQSIATTILQSHNRPRTDVGNELAPDLSLASHSLNRDQLRPSFVQTHLEQIRDSVRYFLEDLADVSTHESAVGVR